MLGNPCSIRVHPWQKYSSTADNPVEPVVAGGGDPGESGGWLRLGPAGVNAPGYNTTGAKPKNLSQMPSFASFKRN